MKTTILATLALSAFLFSSCNSGSSNKNNAASNNEMEQMQPGTQHDEMEHMTSGEAHEEHAMLNVKGECEMCKDRIEKAAKGVEGVSFASWEIEKQVLHLNSDLLT
jgi:Cu(I)/Ag(I) efflux system membrane fusion protein